MDVYFISRKEAHTCGRAAGPVSQSAHTRAAGAQVKKQDISPQAPSCPTLPGVTSGLYHRLLVLPGLGPLINSHTVYPSCICLLKCVCEICFCCGVQLIWVPF